MNPSLVALLVLVGEMAGMASISHAPSQLSQSGKVIFSLIVCLVVAALAALLVPQIHIPIMQSIATRSL